MTTSAKAGNRNRDEPVTPTRPSQSTARSAWPTALSAHSTPSRPIAQPLSYRNGSSRGHYPADSNATFARINRECGPTPPPLPNYSRSPSPEGAEEQDGSHADDVSPAQALDDPFVCPSPGTFGASASAARPTAYVPPSSASNQQRPQTPRQPPQESAGRREAASRSPDVTG